MMVQRFLFVACCALAAGCATPGPTRAPVAAAGALPSSRAHHLRAPPLYQQHGALLL